MPGINTMPTNESVEQVKDNFVPKEDAELVKEFKKYYTRATVEEQQKLDKQFVELSENRVKDAIPNSEESLKIDDGKKLETTIFQEDIENVATAHKLKEALDQYPNIDPIQYEAVQKLSFDYMLKREKKIGEVLEKDKQQENNVDK